MTPIISVALVLLILGIVGVLAMTGRKVSDNIKENLGFNIIMADDAPQESITSIKQMFTTAPYVAAYEYMSADDILTQEEALLGEDIVEIVGVNPYQPEFNVRVKAAYADVDSINAIVAQFRPLAEVDSVIVHAEMVREINHNIQSLSLGLLIVALALLAISFVLINNTVRLTIYSMRFLLHTMRLVGATDGFIRRPIVRMNLLSGFIAGIVGALLLWGLVGLAMKANPEVMMLLDGSELLPVYAAMPLTGMLICGIAAWTAAGKYLRRDYDELF